MTSQLFYTAVDHGPDTDLYVYTDNMRKLKGTFVKAGGNRKIVATLYSQGIAAAIQEAKTLDVEWIVA